MFLCRSKVNVPYVLPSLLPWELFKAIFGLHTKSTSDDKPNHRGFTETGTA